MLSALLFWWMRVNDMSKKEQISVIVRYLQPESGEVHEEFLHFTAADRLDADSLLASVKHTLSQ